VVTASRDFVCIRPATYESAAEAAVLKSFFPTRSGELENTVFVLLAPDGKTALSRGGRSPAMVFDDAAGMAASMARIVSRYPGSKKERTPTVPLVADVRRGLNVAACDNRPLIVVAAAEPGELQPLLEKVAGAAWCDELIGRARWAAAASAEELDGLAAEAPELLVVAPDQYGLGGKVVAYLAADAKPEQLERGLVEAMALFAPEAVDARAHVRGAAREGIEWESEIPVTDPGESRRR